MTPEELNELNEAIHTGGYKNVEGCLMYHNPVLLHESIDALAIKADGIYVDATFGGGGHSRLILSG